MRGEQSFHSKWIGFQVIWRMNFFGPPILNIGQTDFIFDPYKVSELDNNICMADGIRRSISCILERFFELAEVWSLENFRFSTTFVLKTVCLESFSFP